MPPPNDLEAGLPNGSTRSIKEPHDAEKLMPDAASGRPSIAPSAVPSAMPDDASAKRHWWSRQQYKPKKAYAPPPTKEQRSELETFQNLVGIHFLRPGGGLLYPEDQGFKPASPMHDIFVPTKAAAKRWRNRGLYDRTLSQDIRNRVLYGMSLYIISFLYLLQILIAAALTGLSAYQQASSVALTTLGAINTVLAGILAWLNGQGMPVRFRRARDQYREVVRAIEDTERTFAEIDYVDWPPGKRPNPYAERDRLEQMYDEARQDQERNYPDIQEGPNKQQMESEAKQLRGNISDEKSKADAFAKTLKDTRNHHKSQLEALEKSIVARIEKAVNDQKDRIRTEVHYEHLQKIADEQERRLKELGYPGEHPPKPRGPEQRRSQPAEKAKQGAKPRDEPRQQPRGPAPEQPREQSREQPRGGPRDGLRDGPRSEPREASRPAPRETSPNGPPILPPVVEPSRSPVRSPVRSPERQRPRSPARSPERRPSRSPARSPVRSPERQPAKSPARSPERQPARSPVRSPERQPARSPSRSPARSPERPPVRSPSRSPIRSPSRSPSSSPSRSSSDSGPEPRGPPGLFMNQPKKR